jgi:hypothetical protein
MYLRTLKIRLPKLETLQRDFGSSVISDTGNDANSQVIANAYERGKKHYEKQFPIKTKLYGVGYLFNNAQQERAEMKA